MSNSLIEALSNVVEQQEDTIAGVNARLGLMGFVVIHAIRNGALADLTAQDRDLLRRLIAAAEKLAAAANQMDAIEPLTSALRSHAD